MSPMPTQTSFAKLGCVSKKRLIRRERFLAQIDRGGNTLGAPVVVGTSRAKCVLNPAKPDKSGPRVLKGGSNRPLSTPHDHIPAACGPIFGQFASAAALETGGRGLFSGFLGRRFSIDEFVKKAIHESNCVLFAWSRRENHYWFR